jgi:tRNA nucleotidyltransferase (CCA-adding enzyme)
MKAQQIVDEVLMDLKPTAKKEQYLTRVIEEFLQRVNDALKKKKIDAHAIIGGSFAKQTWLVDEFDVDIFVKFAPTYEDGTLSDLLASAIKALKPVRVHGSRDYFQVDHGDIRFELVPVLNIQKVTDARNVTDASPFHVDWVARNGAGVRDDIRAAKQFFKANRLYGAESYIQGFSGHVVDILVIHYGGFIKLLKATKRWKDKLVVDPNKEYKGRAMHHLNLSKTQGPLVVVDPVQKERNAAAAVGQVKYDRLRKVAQDFLKNPSDSFFTKQSVSVAELKKQGAVVVVCESLEGKRDVVGAKIMKVFEYLARALADFEVIEAGWDWPQDPAILWFMLKNHELPKIEVRTGPPATLKDAVKAFKAKHENTFVEGGVVRAKISRKYTDAKECVLAELSSPYVKQRVREAKLK